MLHLLYLGFVKMTFEKETKKWSGPRVKKEGPESAPNPRKS